MGDPMFGWAAIEVIKVIRLCNQLIVAYKDGPDGARSHFENFREQVRSCKAILEDITEELESQDTKIYIGLSSLTTTLEDCLSLLNKGFANVYSKPKNEGTIPRKAVGAVVYLWSGQEDLNRLSRSLGVHIKYISVFLQLVQRLVHSQNFGYNKY